MAKIVILTGSPHNPGTSKQLADAFEKGARKSNEVYRYDAGLHGKEAPHFLQLTSSENGIKDDDLVEQEVIPKLLDADVVALVSSLYYFGLNAQLKAVIDRFYSYNHELKDKKTVMLATAYGTQDDLGPLKIYINKFQKYMRWSEIGSVYADHAWEQERLAQHVQEAYQLGQSIH